jgi:hypothetical protein
MGLTLRKVAVMRLNRLQRRVEPLNAWDDVLDRCVHVANGLRMVGSVKMGKCTRCKDARKKMKNVGFDKFVLCDDCQGKTLVNDGRAYTALLLLDSLGNKDVEGTEEVRQNRYLCVKLSSIRCFSPTGVRQNEFFVLPPGVGLEEPGARAGSKPGTLIVSRKELRSKDKREVQGNNKLVPVLEEFLNNSPLMSQLVFTTPTNPYKDVIITKVIYNKTSTGKGMVYLVNIDGAGSTYCNNKNGFHNSSKVFFEIRSKYMVQRCFCNKSPAVEGATPCKTYKSPKVIVPQDLRQLLFPVAAPKALELPAEQLRDNVSRNMEGCAVVKKVLTKQKKQSVFLQTCWQEHRKRLEMLNHLAITSGLEPVPLTKDTMYPSRVSSQLCKLTSNQVDHATAAELFNMTEEVVRDLGTKEKADKPKRARKRKFSEQEQDQ